MHTSEDTEADIGKTRDYASRQTVAESQARARLAHEILDEILAFVRPGTRESEVKDFAFARFAAHGVERPWHMPYIRFGSNTLLIYRDKAKEDRVLAEEDIAFADIGVVKNGVEGDAGRTIVFGSNKMHHALRAASEDMFHELVDFWKQHDPTGEELHAEAHEAAKKRGFLFNLDPAGHLIGTFPHKGWKRGLNHFPEKIEKGVWVLEIQIRHSELPCGAFFEDLLA
jgi:Xaa-Pro aminopeptidase